MNNLIKAKAIQGFLKCIQYLLIIFFLSGHQLSAQVDSVTINIADKHQVIEGFGGGLAFYEDWLTIHPNRSEIYNLIFGGLSLDILRVRDAFEYEPAMVGIVKKLVDNSKISLGHPIDLLFVSWSPSASCKSNNNVNNGGTLKYVKNGTGVIFNYKSFAGWWYNSLLEYNYYNLYPKYISIQNEPDFKASWQTCLLFPNEIVTPTDTIAGYDKAFNAVYDTLNYLPVKPRMLAPESAGIAMNVVQNYADKLDLTKVYGIAHHLYNGGNSSSPDSYQSNLLSLGQYHPEIPHFQTEFSSGDGWFKAARLIHNCLVYEETSAYLYWDLIWPNSGGLVTIYDPNNKATWKNSKGYTVNAEYFAFKQYSAFIHPGWKRVGSTVKSSNGLLVSGYMSNGSDSLSVIVLNPSASQVSVKLATPNFTNGKNSIYRTSSIDSCRYVGALDISSNITLPATSITTIVFTPLYLGLENLSQSVHNVDFTLDQNYPNPFNLVTTIKFTSEKKQGFHLTIYNALLQELETINLGVYPEGVFTYLLNGSSLKPGIYFYSLENERGKRITKKFMIKQ